MILMTQQTILQRMRIALLALSAFIFFGTVFELILTEHYKTTTQFIPFVLSGLGFLSVLAVLIRPNRWTLRVMRWLMLIIILGSLFGIWEHLEGNFAFQFEMRPSATLKDVFWKALKGAAPLVAPGILAFSGLMALIATYFHPAIVESQQTAPSFDMAPSN